MCSEKELDEITTTVMAAYIAERLVMRTGNRYLKYAVKVQQHLLMSLVVFRIREKAPILTK